MTGTREGGAKAGATNKQRYGADYYRTIGGMGGRLSKGGGFQNNRQLASKAGSRGGRNSRAGIGANRYQAYKGYLTDPSEQSLMRLRYDEKLSVEQAATRCGLPTDAAQAMIRRINMRLYMVERSMVTTR